MALQGAELLLYPTAIGTEPQDATLDSSRHWQRVMQGMCCFYHGVVFSAMFVSVFLKLFGKILFLQLVCNCLH